MNRTDEERILRAFGERVRLLRKEKGLSQEGLALGGRLDRTYIGGVERGERNLSLINIFRIAEALGVTPADLLDSETRAYLVAEGAIDENENQFPATSE